jgi:hypothetical protein
MRLILLLALPSAWTSQSPDCPVPTRISKDGSLILSCTSVRGSCPEKVMVFGKSP